MDNAAGNHQLPAPEPFVAWLNHYGHAHFGTLAEELWEEIPDLRASPEGTKLALRDSIISHLPGLQAAFSGVQTDFSLPDTAREFAQAMAQAGTPLSAVLRSYEVGHGAIWNALTGYLRSLTHLKVEERAEYLERGSMVILDYMQAMTGETIAVYNRVRDQLLREQHSRKAQIIRSVLAGQGNPEDLQQFLGYPVEADHIGYVVWQSASGAAASPSEIVRRLLNRHLHQHIAMPHDSNTTHGWFTLHKPSDYRQLSTIQLPEGIGLAFGSVRRGFDGFRQTHEEAQSCASLSTEPAGSPTSFPQAAVHVLATQNKDLARRFMRDQLGSLLHHEDRERLLPTLHQFVSTLGSPSRSALRLGIHPNTVNQRIKRIETILCSPVNPADLNLRMALELEPLLDSAE